MRRKPLTRNQAAQIAKVSAVTITAWCEEYGIGYKVGGRWKVDVIELRKMLSGQIHQELKLRRGTSRK